MFPDKNSVTIRQIADRAGVSVGTVSHVINRTAGVRDAVQRRVLAAVDQLGYRPSLLARSLRRNETTILGMIVPDILNPFFPQVVRGVEDVAFQHGYQVILCNTDNEAGKERSYFEILRAYRMAGLIVIPSAYSHLKALTAGAGPRHAPLVCLDRCVSGWKADSVTVDNLAGSYQATQWLIAAGHQRIATITGPLQLGNAMERLRGFRRALRQAGIPLPMHYVQEGNFDRLSGYRQGLVLLRGPHPPTAIFAANDLVALGVLTAIRELGLRCPQDVSLIGFDDLEIASLTDPPLTTVAQPGYEMGARAAELLLQQLKRRSGPAQQVVLQTTLKQRGSVAGPPVTGVSLTKRGTGGKRNTTNKRR